MRASRFAPLLTVASAARFTLHLPASTHLNPSTLPASTHATLQSTGPPLDVYLTRSNTFPFANVSAGSYFAVVHARDYAFEALRIDVSVEEGVEGGEGKREMIRAWRTFLGNEWDDRGEARGEGGNGVVLESRVLGRKEFYMQREGFQVLSFLKSPMILMALVSMGLMFGMPYLLDNMDPETKAEFEEMQKQSVTKSTQATGTAQALQNFDLASWMAGKTTDAVSRAQSPAPQGSKKKG